MITNSDNDSDNSENKENDSVVIMKIMITIMSNHNTIKQYNDQ